jgi:hypothetical protein
MTGCVDVAAEGHSLVSDEEILERLASALSDQALQAQRRVEEDSQHRPRVQNTRASQSTRWHASQLGVHWNSKSEGALGGQFRLHKLGPSLVLMSCPPTPLDLRMLSSMGFRAVLNLAPVDARSAQANCEHLGLKYR